MKRDLAKLALAALVVAANTTSVVQASEEVNNNSVFLASAACGGSGCSGKAKRNEISDNTNYSDSYNSNTNAYQAGKNTNGYGSSTSTYSNPSSSSAYGNSSYGTSSNWNSSTNASNLTDDEFRAQLNSDQKKDFDKLNANGKSLAKSLANDPKYADKNAAVKEALKRQNNSASTSTR